VDQNSTPRWGMGSAPTVPEIILIADDHEPSRVALEALLWLEGLEGADPQVARAAAPKPLPS